MSELPHEFEPGEWVIDQHPPEDTDNARMLVVDCLNRRADEVVIFKDPDGGGRTVADYNQQQWVDSPVIRVVYEDALNYRLQDRFPEWTVEDIIDLYDAGVLTEARGTGGYGLMDYSFPEARVKPDDD